MAKDKAYDPPKGGSYVVGEDGKRVRKEGTADHPDGNRARDAKGRPLDAAGVAMAEPDAPADRPSKAAPAAKSKKG